MSIKFNHLSYTYMPKTPFETKALKDVDIELAKGKITAVIGHTGSGKSTFVQHINALLVPSEGSINVDEYLISSNIKKLPIKQLRKHAGMVFQFPEYQLFEENCFKDIAFGPKNYGVKEEDFVENAKRLLKLVGLDETYMYRSPFELSGGQKRRVAIAGILALEPEILILDEPTAGLDPKGTSEMLDLFASLNKTLKTTIILVTHDMSQVLKYADEAIVLKKGQVVAKSTPIDIFNNEKLLNDIDIEAPEVVSFAKELISNGLKIDLTKVKDIDSLTDEIMRNK